MEEFAGVEIGFVSREAGGFLQRGDVGKGGEELGPEFGLCERVVGLQEMLVRIGQLPGLGEEEDFHLALTITQSLKMLSY
jgi:hypothetical protein